MENARISPHQLFSLLFLFEMGTALVVPLGMDADQDAWIAILLGLAGGLVLFWGYGLLFRLFPNLSLYGQAQTILGTWLGWLLGFFYILFFIYGAARVLRDGGNLLLASMYGQTPLLAINALMIIGVAYVIKKGIEVLGRIAEIFLILIIVSGILGNLAVYISGIEIKNLLPVLEKGWEPVFMVALKQMIMFPFGETIAFTTILPYVVQPRLGIKRGMIAMSVSGILLSYTTALEVSVLGADMAGRSMFPLLNTISVVNIADIVQRLDAIVALSLIIGDFFKVAIFFYAAVIGATDLFQLQNDKKIVLPIAIVILLLSMMMAGSFPEHLSQGKIALQTVFPLFSVGFPLLLLVTALIRKRWSSRS